MDHSSDAAKFKRTPNIVKLELYAKGKKLSYIAAHDQNLFLICFPTDFLHKVCGKIVINLWEIAMDVLNRGLPVRLLSHKNSTKCSFTLTWSNECHLIRI